LYIAGAGIKPASTVPICLDLGTNTQKFLEDPLYIGVRQKRPAGPEVCLLIRSIPALLIVFPTISKMDEFMDEFMEAMSDVFPQLLVQFEDFSTDNAFKYLDRFRSQYRCFNDDVCLMSRPAWLHLIGIMQRSKAQVW
jgi:malate dehydrogenase (oxaloacetate-decarboxylating)(NADP+)